MAAFLFGAVIDTAQSYSTALRVKAGDTQVQSYVNPAIIERVNGVQQISFQLATAERATGELISSHYSIPFLWIS